MTDPKDKAEELVKKFMPPINEWNTSMPEAAFHLKEEFAKDFATIAIDEIIELLEDFNYYENAGRADMYGVIYWKKVKEEIQKL